MWKRLNNPKGARQPVVGGPVSNEAIIDQNPYGSGLGIDVIRAQSNPGKSLPPRPLRDDIPKGLPSLPFEPLPPPPPEHQDSTFRPSSQTQSNSITTQFTRPTYTTSRGTPSATYADDVSPPSSPDVESSVSKGSREQAGHDVSPIDGTLDSSQLGLGVPSSRLGTSSKPLSSNIPVLRREKKRNRVAAVAANLVSRKDAGNSSTGRKTADVRWDPYSGEQTTSEKGKPQSMKPGQFTPPALRRTHEQSGIPLGNESSVTVQPKAHQSFGERIRKFKIDLYEERSGWNGASGGVAVISPIEDQLESPPLSIPRKSSSRVASPNSESSPPVSVIRSAGGETSPKSTLMSDNIDATIRTVISNTGQRPLNSPISAAQDPIPNAPGSNVSARRDSSPADISYHQKEDSTGTLERNFRETFKDLSFTPGNPSDPYVEPPSRFSVTTYAPSEAQTTPRLSTDTFDHPPMPTPPQNYTTANQPSPIVNRKPPKVNESPRLNESPKATARKAVSPHSPVFFNMSDSIASKRVSNIAKTLPQSPAEAESQDLVSSLQAQLEDLAHRKNNIMKSIRQMTELMPTDGVMITHEVRRKREEEKRKVERLREEEADVRRQEHEIGLRLHRAWKRRDKDAVYEQTGLWVRRATG